MLAQRYTDQRGPGRPNPFADILGMHRGPEEGRLGDYALTQQALDQIMTALMENSNAHRPAPATDEVLNKLEREVLEEGAPLLEKDCAVCKDQFALRTEDPDEQVVITLPCKHPFHSPCILPWLKQNGTCPTCRHQLVPQPGSASNPNGAPENEPGPSTGTSNPPRSTPFVNPFAQSRGDSSSFNWSTTSRDRGRTESPERNDGGGGFFGMVGNLFHSLAGGHQNSGPVPSSSDSGPGSLPGSWEPNPSSRPEFGNRTPHTRNQSNQSTAGLYHPSGPRRFQTTPSYDPQSSAYGSNHTTSSNNRDRNGAPINERTSHRRGSYDRLRRRDRDGQRRNTYDHPELD